MMRRQRANGSRHSGLSAGAVIVATLGILASAWYVLATQVIDDPTLLPTPGEFVSRARVLLAPHEERSIWPDIQASVVRILSGWALGVVVGVPLGAILAGSRLLRLALDPIIEAGRAIPPLAWSPLLVVWLGIGETSKVALLFMAVLPVMIITSVAAVSGVDTSWKRAAASLGASRGHTYLRVVLPATAPDVVTSMRVTMGLAWSALIAAELVASTEGLGYRILQAGRFLDTATIFVGIAVIGLLAFMFDLVLRLLHRAVAPWKGLA